MIMKEKENLDLQDLEKSADELLQEIDASAYDASEKALLKLEKMTERAAKIAFGADLKPLRLLKVSLPAPETAEFP